MNRTLRKKFLLTVCILLLAMIFTACNKRVEHNERNLVGVRIENSTIEIYKGAFNERNVQVYLDYEDGTTEPVTLTQADLPEMYHPLLNQVGSFKVETIYRGFKINFNIIVKDPLRTVTFLNYNDCVVKTVTIDMSKNETVIPPTFEEMYVEGYRFTGEYDNDFSNVTSDITVKGIYVKTFLVEFFNGNSELISSQYVDIGADAIEPSMEQRTMPGYVWHSWDNDFTNIQQDTKVYGVYLRVYTITYSSDDENLGTVSGSVESGSNIQIGTNITLTAEAKIGCNFEGWYLNTELVSTDAEYTFLAYPQDYNFVAKFIGNTGNYSEGLYFISNGDGTCYVAGIGTCTDTDLIIPPISPDGDSVTGIGDGAFLEKWHLTSVIIPDSVIIIGDSAFKDCDRISKIDIPDSIIKIGDYAFLYCDGLNNINFGENSQLASIGYEAFYNCQSIMSVTIPKNVTSIGGEAFAWCYNLANITVSEDNAAYTSINGILYSKDVTTLIQYPIGKSSNTFHMPDSVKYIMEKAFFDCDNIVNVTFGENSMLTNIGDYAFAFCDNIIEFSVPNSVIIIGDYAFERCVGLTSISFGESSLLQDIGFGVFSGCSLGSIIIPASVVNIGPNALFCKSLINITVEEGNAEYESIDGNLYNKGATQLIRYAPGNISSTFIVPDSVRSIFGYAFSYSSYLKNIIIPTNVSDIQGFAFMHCTSLTSIIIPEGVTSIDSYAFYGCYGLTDVYFTGSEAEWFAINIGDNNEFLLNATIHFNYRKYSEGLEFTSNGDGTCSVTGIGDCTDTDLIIPSISPDGDSVTSIADFAFEDCINLTSVTIPNSVTAIGDRAFIDCSALTDVYYDGSEEEWANVSIDSSGNSYLTNATIHYNYVPEE